MNSQSAQSYNGSSSSFQPMRVVLISYDGEMRSIALPAIREGRYKFLNEDGNEDIPIYIEAISNRWIARAGRNGYFFKDDPSTPYEEVIGPSIEISDKLIVNVCIDSAKYYFFSEFELQGSNVFRPYYLADPSDCFIGRLENNDIQYPSDIVSRRHAKLSLSESRWSISDLNSTNGVFVNGKRIESNGESTPLFVGDRVFIVGLTIIIGVGFVSINNANNRISFHTPKIHRIQRVQDIIHHDNTLSQRESSLYDRQPRKMIKIDPDPITIEMPPMPLSAAKMPLLLRFGSSMMMSGNALLTGNIMNAVSSLSNMVFPAITQRMTDGDRKKYEEMRTDRYREYLKAKAQEIADECSNEESLLNENYPELNKVLSFITTQNRLWERRKTDDDFLKIRIGYGKIPMIAKKNYPQKKFELERDFLVEEMYEVAETPSYLRDAPVMVSLKDDPFIGIVGASEAKHVFVRNFILQLALTHSYDEVKVILISETKLDKELGFVPYLPHCWSDDKSIRFFVNAPVDAQQLSKYLNDTFEEDSSSHGRKDSKAKASYVVISLSKSLFDSIETFKTILNEGSYCGFSLIAAFDGMPKECSKVINVNKPCRLVDYLHPDEDDQEFSLDKYDTDMSSEAIARLKKTKLMLNSSQYSLPSMLTFLEMFNAGKVEHLNPVKRWENNNPVKSLAAPVGVGTDGQTFYLDLHEKRQGPHGLVAGMTGSGKSEFIITYILSMAVNYSPDEVAFVLIDYKGGGLTGAFINEKQGVKLPHIVGTITNLDGTAIRRSLVSINSELKRRQLLFNEAKADTNAGTIDIYDYQKLYRNHKVREPLPHLFIISDEFAELKSQQPGFMDELISTARIGRSLGVHLILATQKPSGVVNDQIWSNTRFRVCLRVQDKSDSTEMLKRHEAAEIKNTGRFYLQVGYNELFALGQSAWCGAEYTPQEEVLSEKDHSIRFVDASGQTIHSTRPETKRQSTGEKQIVTVVRYLSDLAKRLNIKPRSLWLDPLPDVIDYSALQSVVPKSNDNGIQALIGIVDDPERQNQFPFIINMLDFRNMMLVGTSGSGKSTFLRTMLYSLVSAYSPQDVAFFILDLSNKVLSVFEKAPHCCAYLTDENDDDITRMLQFIKRIVAKRKEQFSKAEVTTFEAYRKIERIPLILVVVDSYMNLPSLACGEEILGDIQNYLREGANFGIRFILTCNHTNEISSRAKQEIDLRAALQVGGDKYNYTEALDVKCSSIPSEKNGRGMCVIDGNPLEYHVAMLDSNLSEQNQSSALKERIDRLSQQFSGIASVPKLPMVDFNQPYADFCSGFDTDRIPIGFALGDLRTVAMPLQQLRSMSLYFGNPKGIKPVFSNILTAAGFNKMDVIILKRSSGSVFDDIPLEQYICNAYPLDMTIDNIAHVSDTILEKVRCANKLRDEYCVQNNIPLDSTGKSRKAAKYVREMTTPLLIIFECFSDFCAIIEEDEDIKGRFWGFFQKLSYRNIYFCAGFYPDDDQMTARNETLKYYNQEEFFLLFGGRFDKAAFASLPYALTKVDSIDPSFNQLFMKYRSGIHSLVMPCGVLDSEHADPDERDIV